jgi:hypothetical protein
MKTIWQNIPSDDKRIREFGIVIFLVAGVLIPVFMGWKRDWIFPDLSMKLFVFSIVFLLLTLFLKPLMRPVYKAWMLLAIGMGFVMTRVIITLVYLLLMTPIGIIRRWGRNELSDSFFEFPRKTSNTYWIRRTDRWTAENSEKQY